MGGTFSKAKAPDDVQINLDINELIKSDLLKISDALDNTPVDELKDEELEKYDAAKESFLETLRLACDHHREFCGHFKGLKMLCGAKKLSDEQKIDKFLEVFYTLRRDGGCVMMDSLMHQKKLLLAISETYTNIHNLTVGLKKPYYDNLKSRGIWRMVIGGGLTLVGVAICFAPFFFVIDKMIGAALIGVGVTIAGPSSVETVKGLLNYCYSSNSIDATARMCEFIDTNIRKMSQAADNHYDRTSGLHAFITEYKCKEQLDIQSLLRIVDSYDNLWLAIKSAMNPKETIAKDIAESMKKDSVLDCCSSAVVATCIVAVPMVK